ncbi:MAG: ABC transporter substrate-binding protein [Pirellulaceae bacterium]|nr:ABC transporter substrate-binding protein [Pirellulaceae bacterium]
MKTTLTALLGWSVAVFGFGSVLMLCCGCQSETLPQTDKISLQLNWFPDAQHGGFYMAQLKGYYSQEGLDVEILAGGPGANVEAKVDRGKVEFGIANAHRILLKRNEGAKISAVFASFQKSPRCIMVHRESGIRTFEDLEGVTLAVGSDAAFRKFMEQNVDLHYVKLVSYSGSNATFLQDKNYAQQAYSISEPILVKRQGADPVVLMLSDIGFNPYTSCVFASEDYLKNNPETVRKFVRASQKGWEAYLENPEFANQKMAELNKEHDLIALNQGAAAAAPLCRPKEGEQIGSMNPDRWKVLVAQLKNLKMLKPDFQLNEAFTVDFLPVH